MSAVTPNHNDSTSAVPKSDIAHSTHSKSKNYLLIVYSE